MEAAEAAQSAATAYQITTPVLVTALAALGWYLIRREISKSDLADEKWKAEVHESFQKRVEAQEASNKRIHDLELQMVASLKEQDLKDLKAELKDDMNNTRDTILGAIRAMNGHS